MSSNKDLKILWKELGSQETESSVIIKFNPKKEQSINFEHIALGRDGTTLFLPIVGGMNERAELYNISNGSLDGIFRPVPQMNLADIQFLATNRQISAPMFYGLGLWNPFFYQSKTEQENRDSETFLIINDDETVMTLNSAKGKRSVSLQQLRNLDGTENFLTIQSAFLWPNDNHLLVGFSDLQVSHYQIVPFKKLAHFTHHIDSTGLTSTQNHEFKTVGWSLKLDVSLDGRHFVSWSENGIAQIWDLFNPDIKARSLGSLEGIMQILYSPTGDFIWALHDQQTPKVSVFRTDETYSLLRTISIGFDAQVRNAIPDYGIAVVADKQPILMIDPNTGMSLATYFQNLSGMQFPDFFEVGKNLLFHQIETKRKHSFEIEEIEKQTGYRWTADMTVPVSLKWDELRELWKNRIQKN